MNTKIENRFLANYILMFIISTTIAIFAVLLLDFAGDVTTKNLVKNKYTANSLMKDDYKLIDAKKVTDNNGGVQIINSDYVVVYSAGLNTFGKDILTTAEFTDFLIMSKSKGVKYSYSIEYNAKEQFWLIVTFPTSIRIDFAIAYNKDNKSVDKQGVVNVIVSVVLFYLMLLAISTVIYSKLTSISIINPLKKLCKSVQKLKEGDYSSRVNLNLKNEFGELENIFNEMAIQIEKEICLKNQSEENRKKLILDISHDLKNPLSSIMGYAQYCHHNPDMTKEEQSNYMKVIYENSVRANNLIIDLFELSKLESSNYKLHKSRVDICEYLRETIGSFITTFDNAGFSYDFNIPEEEIFTCIDTEQMDRVFQNLVSNTVTYNPKGTSVMISLSEKENHLEIIFKDDGIGIPAEAATKIFQSFERVDSTRNSQTGGTGLGLAIVDKIIKAHNGNISLITDDHAGCKFIISIPKI
ncbi:MAG TPA: HAMP domain-containing sensor histidine kinase [Lachnospiraceae bacterium]|nr:HAMP domain-containing sensor histidine kinase [Lachnospiraceae bacterium]